jgi:hypothetical protein
VAISCLEKPAWVILNDIGIAQVRRRAFHYAVPPNETMQISREHFPHQADMACEESARPSRRPLKGQGGLALTVVITDPRSVVPMQAVPIFCEAPDDELLLVDWLNAAFKGRGRSTCQKNSSSLLARRTLI